MTMPMFNRPLYLVTGDLPVPSVAPRSVHARVAELRSKLSALVEEASQIEAELLQLTVEGVLRDYCDVWRQATAEGATPGVLDVLTRSVINSVPMQIADVSEFNTLLRKHTTVNVDVIDGPMCDSFRRVSR